MKLSSHGCHAMTKNCSNLFIPCRTTRNVRAVSESSAGIPDALPLFLTANTYHPYNPHILASFVNKYVLIITYFPSLSTIPVFLFPHFYINLHNNQQDSNIM